MTGLVRRIKFAGALVLLFASMLQPLAAANGDLCGREHPASSLSAWYSPDAGSPMAEGSEASSVPHHHDSVPQPDLASSPAASCAVAALVPLRMVPAPTVTPHKVVRSSDVPPASLFAQSHFRPPRLI